MIRTYEDLDAFQNAKRLYPHITKATGHFPRQGWHLRDQLCRSANSIQANIAEGYGRSVAEFRMYLTRSLGSCNETRGHIENAINVGWIDSVEGNILLDKYTVIGKQLFRLRERWI